jgi:outer membrane receptor protein involved in Fe transport
VGKTEGGVPKWRYTISPRYAIGDAVIGATIRGNTWVYADGANVRKVDGHYIVSAFVNYDFGRGISGSLNVNNLLDKVYPAAGTGFVPGSTTIVGGAETGRTISATVKYAF